MKRVLAVLALIVFAIWILAMVVLAVFPIDIPNKSTVFMFLTAGCIFFPIMIWMILWMISVVTGKKNIASLYYKDNESNPDNEELNLSKSNMKDMNESKESINAVSESRETVNDIEKSE